MASSTWPGNSTIVRNMMLALIKLRFSVGSWLRPEATLRRAYQLFCTPFASSRTRARAIGDFGARRSTMAFGNEQVAVYIWGDASREPYVLLSHGWSSHATRFSKWIEPLRAAGFAVVGFDQLGHGQSSGKRTNLPEFAQVLAAVAERYGQASAVIGHSLGGGAVALMLAEARLAERAILIAPVADPMEAASRFSQLVGLAEKLGRRLFDAYETEHRLPVASLQAYRKVSAIASPVLVVHDLADRDVPWSDGECYARYWPDARLYSTTGLGHHRVVDDAAVIEASLRFLAGEVVGERVVSSPNLPFGMA